MSVWFQSPKGARQTVKLFKPTLLAGVVVLVLGIMVVFESRSLVSGLGMGDPGPGLFPRLIGAGLTMGGAMEVFSSLRLRQTESGGLFSNRAEIRAWILLGILVCYVGLLGRFSYLILTAFFFLVLSRLLGATHWVKNILVSASFSGVFLLVFEQWLKIPLP